MKSAVYSVGVTAVEIAPKQHFERTIIVHCKAGTAHLGNSTVTTTDGLPIANGEAYSIIVPINENLFAIDGAGTASVVVLDSSAE